MIQPSTLTFLSALKKNNRKEWFDNHRDDYNTAKENFEEFVAGVLHKMKNIDNDLQELSVRDCIFRINRDVRFSKDKTPYKVNRSAYFSRGGKKSEFGGYYLHIQPGGKSFAGGGIWMPAAPELKKVRQEIDYCFPDFKKIIAAAPFRKIYGGLQRDEKNMLVNVPKGYEKENPASDFLKMKGYVATRPFSDEEVLSSTFEKHIITSFNALMPLIKFINRGLE